MAMPNTLPPPPPFMHQVTPARLGLARMLPDTLAAGGGLLDAASCATLSSAGLFEVRTGEGGGREGGLGGGGYASP